jgi:hypothetical protein
MTALQPAFPALASSQVVGSHLTVFEQAYLHGVWIVAVAVGNHVFNGIDGPRRQTHGHIGRRTSLRRRNFSIEVGEALHCNRVESKGERGLASPDRRCRVDVRDVAEHTRANLVAVECSFIVLEPGNRNQYSVQFRKTHVGPT